MKSLRNSVHLIGNLGMNPEVKAFEGGNSVARFSLATSENYRNKSGEKVTETQWHKIVAWGKLADIAGKYLKKGNQVAIEGKLTNRNYNDSEGKKRFITEIIVNDILMLRSAN